MSKPLDIIIATADGWEALYVNGVCKMQGHQLDLRDVLREVLPDAYVQRKEADHEWVEHRDCFPTKLEEAQFYGD